MDAAYGTPEGDRLDVLVTLVEAWEHYPMSAPDPIEAIKFVMEQRGLSDGSQVELHLQGRKITVEASKRPRYKLSELMAEMSAEPPRVEGWDDMPLLGMERD